MGTLIRGGKTNHCYHSRGHRYHRGNGGLMGIVASRLLPVLSGSGYCRTLHSVPTFLSRSRFPTKNSKTKNVPPVVPVSPRQWLQCDRLPLAGGWCLSAGHWRLALSGWDERDVAARPWLAGRDYDSLIGLIYTDLPDEQRNVCSHVPLS
jgi:hypothetical protein